MSIHTKLSSYKVVPSIDVVVYDYTEKGIVVSTDTRKVSSFTAASKQPLIVRATIYSLDKAMIVRKLKEISNVVNSTLEVSDYSPAPYRTKVTINYISNKPVYSCEFLFARESYGIEEKTLTAARQIRVDQHGNEKGLMVGKISVGKTEMKWADGISYIRSSKLNALGLPNAFKGMITEKGLSDASHLTNPGAVITGLFEGVSDERFAEIGGSDDCDCITDFGNVKLNRESESFNGHLVFFKEIGFKVDMAELSYQVLREDLSTEGKTLIQRLYRTHFEWVRYILEDRSGIRFCEEVFNRMSTEEEIPSEWKAAHKGISVGLPMTGKEYMDKIIPILSNRKPKVMAGWGCIVPDLTVAFGELSLPRPNKNEMIAFFPGQVVTAVKVPICQGQVRLVKLAEFNDTGCMRVHPDFAKLFGFDFDGDTMTIFPYQLVTGDSMPETVGKKKAETGRTVSEAIASYVMGTNLIGGYDAIIDQVCLARKAGMPIDAAHALEQYQGVIDGMKFQVEPESIKEIGSYYVRHFGVLLSNYQLDPVFSFLRGKTKGWSQFKSIITDTKTSAAGIIGNVSVDDAAMLRYFPQTAVLARKKVLTAMATNLSTPEVMELGLWIQSQYGTKELPDSFIGKLMSGNIKDAYAHIEETNTKLSANPLADKAIKWLWINSVLQTTGFVKSLKMFTYFPMEIGTWSLKKAVEYMGRSYYSVFIR